MLQAQNMNQVEDPSVSEENIESEKDIHSVKETEINEKEIEEDDDEEGEIYTNEELPEQENILLPLPNQIQNKIEEPLLEGERPNSPIIPALRNKLLRSRTLKENMEKGEIEKGHQPNRSITQIGQNYEEEKPEEKYEEKKSIPEHLRNKSVTGLGVDDERSVAIPMNMEESKELGKPPLANITSDTPKPNKKKENLESKFRSSRKKKFTVKSYP